MDIFWKKGDVQLIDDYGPNGISRCINFCSKKLSLFHHSPDYSDEQVSEIEKNAKQKFPNTISAYQGLSISF